MNGRTNVDLVITFVLGKADCEWDLLNLLPEDVCLVEQEDDSSLHKAEVIDNVLE